MNTKRDEIALGICSTCIYIERDQEHDTTKVELKRQRNGQYFNTLI